jgi:hypothetical protein
MPHYMCVACRTRYQIPGAPTDLVGDLCPSCGSLLEPAGELASLVGFRRTTLQRTERDHEAPEVVAVAIALPQPHLST